ncbi:MAG TPA: molybdenum hydroxylase, partial [Dehalococcoidia bacterium]|nr:molybdenum hydroxylase [Dehalococcoidia bacterium]
LGRVILEGEAQPNTGVPGDIGGYGAERLVRAPREGVIRTIRQIGDSVVQGETLALVEGEPVVSPLTGVLRGLIRDGLLVRAGKKIGDVDPRAVREHCFTVSDKSLAVGGGVLEAVLLLLSFERGGNA